MTRKNERLIDCIPYTVSDGSWYIRLIYGYEDEKGKHQVIYPKVHFPFMTCSIPTLINNCYENLGIWHMEKQCGIPGLDVIPVYKDTWCAAIARGNREPAYAFDIITKPAVHEMTLDEIEEKLGYKVKIVNKENDNA